jgi:hypothetical protein
MAHWVVSNLLAELYPYLADGLEESVDPWNPKKSTLCNTVWEKEEITNKERQKREKVDEKVIKKEKESKNWNKN